MKTQQGGIQLVPSLPAVLTDRIGERKEISELIAYRNKLIETRNAQLEYHQNITGLHSKIREACRDLSKKDNNVKGDIETLALERGRLGYLRDELARRAEVISRWEARVRAAESQKDPHRTDPSPSEQMKRKERDRMNAMLVEMDQRNKRDDRAASMEVVTTEHSSEVMGIMSEQHFGGMDIERPTPVHEGIGSDEIRMCHENVDTSDLLDVHGTPPTGVSEEVQEDKKEVPRPYPAWTQGDAFFQDMSVCLDYLWSEYSTDIGEGGDSRLMTLPNLLRLGGDADFDLDTQTLIELFLRTVKLGTNCLVEKKFFLALLQAAATVKVRKPLDSIQTTDLLFSDYLFPLMHRLKMKQRILSSRHPVLDQSVLLRRSN